MTKVLRKHDRRIRVSLFDGRGTANVWVEDGYSRPVSEIVYCFGVHTEAEAISQARAERPKMFEEAGV